MAISLNDFKEGGKLRRFVTQVGLLDKIDSTDVDQKDLLARLMNSIRHSSVVFDKNKDTWSYDEELDNTEVLEDDEINPKVEEPKSVSKKEKPKKDEPKEEQPKKEDELPQVDDTVNYTEVTDAASIPTDTESADVALKGDEAANSVNGNTRFNNLKVSDANISSNVSYSANEEVNIENIQVSGTKE